MKFLKYVFAIIILAVLAGFALFAVMDVPVQQQDITLEIQNEG